MELIIFVIMFEVFLNFMKSQYLISEIINLLPVPTENALLIHFECTEECISLCGVYQRHFPLFKKHTKRSIEIRLHVYLLNPPENN